MLAKIVNGDTEFLNKRVALAFFAGKPAPTVNKAKKEAFEGLFFIAG